MNRRNFFQSAAGAAALGALAAGASSERAAAAVLSPEAAAEDENFWSTIRNEFTVDRSVINFNNGHSHPAPRTVQESLRRQLDFSDMGPYHTMIRQMERNVERARAMIAESAGVDPEEIAITRNSSESLEIAQLGIDLKAGDEVLTTDQDYGRMLTTFKQRERRDGIVMKQISFPVPVVSGDDLYDRFSAAVTDKTKLILVCHITNRTGVIFPIRRICDMAHEKGIPVIVDGAHAFNHFPFKISDLNCDYYGVSLHKWTFAPIGTGFLYVRKDRIKGTWPLMAAAERADDDIRKFEEIGTHPAANHNAICEAVTFNQDIGIERKAARLRYLRDRWATRVAQIPGAKILHSQGDLSCGIGMFTFEDVDKLRELGRTLTSKYNIFTAMSGHRDFTGMRVTPSVYSTTAEVDYFAAAVEEELRKA